MNKRLNVIASQGLIVLNIFVIFLLLFDSSLQPPLWLQAIGRMHPLALHFPIVLILLSMLFELMRPGGKNADPGLRLVLHYLLLTGAWLAGITVIMGIVLSRETGYEGFTLQVHKWTGAAIFFFASVIFFIRNSQWYKAPMAKIAAVLTTLLLIVAGHYGASLTHGDSFISQPLAGYKQTRAVPFDQAIVFKDVIQPILDKKCISCHNPDKIKGELMLTDSAAIMKGGKTGKLFVAGEADMSLLLERLHLPAEDEKHMPPKGKIQLTDAEIKLLTAWVNTKQTYFSQKLIDLPETDTVRMLSAHLLEPAATDEKFDFAAADEKTVQSLNTDYRTILPLAKESPALAVNLYNRDAYSAKQITELEKIKDNIVSLSLNKLPVTDDQLSAVAQFKNLRRLELNFTNVTDKGLDALTPLKELHTLSLSGSHVSFAGLKDKIPNFKALKTISVWNTGITPQEVEQLKTANKQISFIEGFKDDGSDTLKLNPPQVKNTDMVFSSTIPVELFHPVRGVQIRYTLDGTDPDSLHSPIFDNTTVIDKRTKVKAKAFKEGWHPSDMVTFDFLRNSFIPDSVALLTKLTNVHQAEGAHSFFNKKLGVIGANNPAWANYWAGVRSNDMVLVALFNTPITISSYGLHYMLETPTGIYPPDQVEVWGGDNEQQLKLLTTIKPVMPEPGGKPTLETLEVSFKPHTVSYLKIVAKPHIEKERHYLLLVDEMFLN